MNVRDNQLSDIPWVEKYRPKTLRDVSSQSITIQTLQKFIQRDSIPHLIFTGPAGTGKTSTAYALINDIVGLENVHQDLLLERNASDNVRMDTRDEIKNFVNHTGVFQEKYKFVILDEADLIPKAMQSAFRRIIEMAPPNVKFIFMCNYIENIIDPVLSRCAIFRFFPLPKADFAKHIAKICKEEDILITPDILDTIFFISQGDLRRAINLLQMSVALISQSRQSRSKLSLHPDTILEISGFLPKNAMDQIVSGVETKNFNEIRKIMQNNQGFSSRGLFRQISGYFLKKSPHSEKKEKIMELLGEYDFRLTLEANPKIQMDGFFAELMLLMEGAN